MKNLVHSTNDATPVPVQDVKYNKRRSREFAKHTFHTKAAQDGVADFILSKRLMKRPVYLMEPCESATRVKINKECRKLKIAEDRLAKSRAIHCEKRRILEKDKDQVKQLLVMLRDKHIDFEQFVKENHEKRERVQKNMQGNMEGRKKELDELKVQMVSWTKIRKVFDLLLRKYKYFEHFLQIVAAASVGEFKDSDAIIKRYDAISEARNKCDTKHKDDIRIMEENNMQLQQVNHAHEMEIMTLKDRACSLSKMYHTAHARSLVWENSVQMVHNEVLASQQHKLQLADACYNLYVLMCNRQNSKVKIPRGNISAQMETIKASLLKGAKIISRVTRGLTTTGLIHNSLQKGI